MLDAAQEQELVELVKEAQPIVAAHEAQKVELEKLASPVVDALVKAGELDEDQREQAVKNVVNDPVKVAMCLKSTAEALVEKQQKHAEAPAAMGRGADEINKTAGAKPQRSNADQAFLSKLGLV